MPREKVTLVNAGLEKNTEGKGRVLRGRLLPKSLSLLKIPAYQREILSGSRADLLKEAYLNNGSVPDIVLGLRGHKYVQRDESFHFSDEIYIIDGLQRVNAARAAMEEGNEDVSIGASVHFDTTEAWERDIFFQLNAQRTKLSPSILVRNMRYDNQAIALLYQAATAEQDFPLHKRICWNQRTSKGEVITAASCIKVVARLHGHIISGGTSRIDALAVSLAELAKEVGDDRFIKNITVFFQVIEQAWGTHRDSILGPAPWLKESFMSVLARLFSRHTDFWSGSELVVRKRERSKLRLFNVADPQIIQLSGSSGASRDILYSLLRDHLNKGRRAGGKLKLRKLYSADNEEPEPTLDGLDDETHSNGDEHEDPNGSAEE